MKKMILNLIVITLPVWSINAVEPGNLGVVELKKRGSDSNSFINGNDEYPVIG